MASMRSVLRELANRRAVRIAALAALPVLLCIATVLGVRVYDSLTGPPLEPWHTFVPEELSVAEIDATDWQGYLGAEEAIFQSMKAEVTDQLPVEDQVPENRYFEGSALYPGKFATNWNRSYELAPEGVPTGAAVLLHGLTDSPYSMRHFAEHYRDMGFLAVVPRMPGHGTVPGGLTEVEWEEWMATTRMAVREAIHKAGPFVPLHIVGYSNGGALALKYTLDTLDSPEDQRLPKPDRLVLVSPMIGVSAYARFAGLAGLPAIFPAFVKASWLSVLPEYNPFKYNSFPVNGARQSYQLTMALQRQIGNVARSGKIADLPQILTFQSIVDATVNVGALINVLYAQLPANGSELVLFDINRAAEFGPLLNKGAEGLMRQMMPPAERRYRSTIISNVGPLTAEVAENVTEAGTVAEHSRALRLYYPENTYSMSHLSLPFPVKDSLYGENPNPDENFGIHLGRLAWHGEENVLVVPPGSLLRVTSNPFFPFMLERIDGMIDSFARTGS
jgi:alpha-beta hydrolase superfamily lysophospholipase